MIADKKLEHVSRTSLEKAHPIMDTKTFNRKPSLFNVLLMFFSILYLVITGYTGLIIALNVFSFAYFSYKLALTIYGLKNIKDNDVACMDADEDLPKYCVLLPCRNEGEKVIKELVKNIDAIDYPKDKMDVVLLVDSDDDYLGSISNMNLPSHFRILSASPDFPFTKPKVCNLGLYGTDAELVVVYDAEDKPDPLQLRKVVTEFKNKEVEAVQCRLHYKNKNNNLLTRFFNLEYLAWFSLTIKGLENIQGAKPVIPFGGTSQHLRVESLKNIGGWSAYNVTEDADLGVRMARLGMKIVVIDSVTEEIAVSNLWIWIKQRTRWNLGFLVTYSVHTRNVRKLIKDVGVWGFIQFYLSIFGNILAPLIAPPLAIIFFLDYFGIRSGETFIADLPVVALICNYILIVLTHAIASVAKQNSKNLFLSLFQPFYYLLQSISAYRAVWKFFNGSAMVWEKTEHSVEE